LVWVTYRPELPSVRAEPQLPDDVRSWTRRVVPPPLASGKRTAARPAALAAKRTCPLAGVPPTSVRTAPKAPPAGAWALFTPLGVDRDLGRVEARRARVDADRAPLASDLMARICAVIVCAAPLPNSCTPCPFGPAPNVPTL
jgi:hypothetical protein